MGVPQQIERSKHMSEEELEEYVRVFSRSGLEKPLHVYLNYHNNWLFSRKVDKEVIRCDVLLIVGEKDEILSPSYCKGMEKFVEGNFFAVSLECGHFTLLEKGKEVSQAAFEFLNS